MPVRVCVFRSFSLFLCLPHQFQVSSDELVICSVENFYTLSIHGISFLFRFVFNILHFSFSPFQCDSHSVVSLLPSSVGRFINAFYRQTIFYVRISLSISWCISSLFCENVHRSSGRDRDGWICCCCWMWFVRKSCGYSVSKRKYVHRWDRLLFWIPNLPKFVWRFPSALQNMQNDD